MNVNSYWNDRYNAEYTESFDWLFEYKDVAEIIPQLLDPSSQILMVGSGNATFSHDLYDFFSLFLSFVVCCLF